MEPKTIMIIDDNETNVKMLDIILKKEGYNTECITDSKIAIETIKNTLPDLILLDINMPDINGLEICQMVKLDKEIRHIPVIFVSTLSTTEYIVGGLAVGAGDYITKPIKADELKARVTVQLNIAETHKKLFETNEILQNQVKEVFKENSDLHAEVVYALLQAKNNPDANNSEHLERIKNFCSYLLRKTVDSSPYAEEINDNFILEVLSKL